MAYVDEVLADSPVAYWALDETTGTVAADTQAAHPGTFVGGPTLGTAPLLTGGTSVTFDGVDDYVSVPHSSALNGSVGTDMTFECWVKLANPNADSLQVIADKSNLSVASYGQWYLVWDNRSSQGSPRRLRFMAGDTSITDWSGTPAADALAAGGHLAARKIGNNFSVWWNGALVGSTFDGSHNWAASTQPLRFGATQAGYYLTGTLDAVAFYNYGLSNTRIGAHYAAGSGQANSLVAALPSLQGALSATVTEPSAETASLVGQLPGLAASLAGESLPPSAETASLAGQLPGLVGALGGVSEEPAVASSSTYANYGYGYTGVGAVDYMPPIAPTPARVRRVKVQRVHQSLPAPTLVDGRPV